MKLKKRFLFPLIYIVLFALSFVVPRLGDVLFVFCESLISILFLGITIAIGGPKAVHDLVGIDLYYLVILGTIIQFFLLGYLWDITVEWFRNKKYWE